MAASAFARRVGILAFIVRASLVGASSFLSRAQEANVKELTPELEASILQEIEAVLGSDNHDMTQSRLARIEEVLSATFQALPKNEYGRLHHVAVRYSLHSYFVQRHAWSVRGLSSLAEDGLSAASILQDKVEEFVQGAFEQRLGTQGLDLKDLAVLAATYENLVRKEMMQRLDATLIAMEKKTDQFFSARDMESVIDYYMMGYILNLNYTVLKTEQLPIIRSSMKDVYPSWPETQKFLREVQNHTAGSFHKAYFVPSDVVAILEAVFDQYGRWQDKECQELKKQLSALEDKSIGVNGSGRVRLADFYGSALRDGNWQFSESTEYLQQSGALDNHGVDRVIIANYVNSPSNCLASSKFYSVCCINECEDLMDHIEHRFGAPTAKPADIIEFVTQLPSSSVISGRSLHKILVQRLEEIALRYDGHVPLHGRLFAQWMHHAYPRECPYPHIAGTTRPQSVEDWMAQGQPLPVATKAQMESIAGAARSDVESSDECTQWSHHEELYVGDHRIGQPAVSQQGVWHTLRPWAFAAALTAIVLPLMRSASSFFTPSKGSKMAYSSKDLFV